MKIEDFKNLNELLTKFGNKEANFVNFYKYHFTYVYEEDDIKIEIEIGGNASEIYRWEMNQKVLISNLIDSDYEQQVEFQLVSLTIGKNKKEYFGA